jgi:hypothetical protein
MAPQDLLPMVFCLIDDQIQALGLDHLRSRGPRRAKPADSEVITIEPVGESWGLADDRALYRYLRLHHAAELPALLGCTAPPSPARPPASAGPSGGSSAGWPPG